MSERESIKKEEQSIVQHIFMASAALVGVCLTAINLVHLRVGSQLETEIDDLLTLDAFMFLLCGALAYTALRKCRSSLTRMKIEKWVDYLFLAALLLMVMICGLITYELM